MTATAATFTTTQRATIEALRADLTRRIRHTVTAEYGETDCGQHWAALGVEELPPGAFGHPGALVSILTGAGIPNEAAAMAADGSSLAHGVSIAQAVQAARFAAVREYRQMCAGALKAA